MKASSKVATIETRRGGRPVGEKREAEERADADRSERAARSWNEILERYGSFADEHSTL